MRNRLLGLSNAAAEWQAINFSYTHIPQGGLSTLAVC
jgi:hypothetical protein